jgi:hypothetical protein
LRVLLLDLEAWMKERRAFTLTIPSHHIGGTFQCFVPQAMS